MMKKLAIFLLIVFCFGQVHAQTDSVPIAVTQIGFYPFAPKFAFLMDAYSGDNFFLLNQQGDTVYRGGVLQEKQKSAFSSTTTRMADFTGVQQPGVYRVVVPEVGHSYSFRIAPNILDTVVKTSLKGYYFIRSNQALEPAYAGQWARPAGHPDDKVLVHVSAATRERPQGTIISSPGGWYDAGDYNKYIVNSGITMGTLMSAYEDFSDYYKKLNTHIPESTNGIPDILDEVLYNLRWMLTMQDPNDGGVYHKLTNAEFDGMVMPGVTKEPRYVVQKSTAATLDFAAVMAQAQRIFAGYGKQLPGLADSCLQAAKAAWDWAKKHPAIAYDQSTMNMLQRPRIQTGAYGDKQLADEWFWASAELLATTGEAVYLPLVTRELNQPMTLQSWSNVQAMGFYTLNRFSKKLASQLSASKLKSVITGYADRLIENGGNKAFGTIMGQGKEDFIWGSNAVAANQGMALINAYLASSDLRYIAFALTNMDYILGRNALNECFITGMGSRSPMHIHHRPSEADGIAAPVPGLLSGGPNPGMQDKCSYPFTEAEKAWVDNVCSYASNEIAINWNAPLVYLSGSLEALQSKIVFSKK